MTNVPCGSGGTEEATTAEWFGLVGGRAPEESAAPSGNGHGRGAEAAEGRPAAGRGRPESSGAEAERGRLVLQGSSGSVQFGKLVDVSTG